MFYGIILCCFVKQDLCCLPDIFSSRNWLKLLPWKLKILIVCPLLLVFLVHYFFGLHCLLDYSRPKLINLFCSFLTNRYLIILESWCLMSKRIGGNFYFGICLTQKRSTISIDWGWDIEWPILGRNDNQYEVNHYQNRILGFIMNSSCWINCDYMKEGAKIAKSYYNINCNC